MLRSLSALLLLVLTGCSGVTTEVGITPEPTRLRITGSEEMVGLVTDLTNRYTDDHPTTIFDVTGGGSRWGRRAVVTGAADIGMVSHPLDAGEEPALRPFPIGYDGLAVIVHPANPVTALSRDALATIFSGDVYRWNAFGWDDREIVVVTREAGAGDRDVFEAFVLGARDLTLNALIAPTPAAVVETVVTTPGAIGYVSASRVSSTRQRRAYDVNVIAVEAMRPTDESIVDGLYPLTRPLLLVTQGRPRDPVRRFISWVESSAGQAIVEREFVPAR